MPPALAYAPGAAEVDLLAGFVEHTARIGLHGVNQQRAERGLSCGAGPTRKPGPASRCPPGWRCRT